MSSTLSARLRDPTAHRGELSSASTTAAAPAVPAAAAPAGLPSTAVPVPPGVPGSAGDGVPNDDDGRGLLTEPPRALSVPPVEMSGGTNSNAGEAVTFTLP